MPSDLSERISSIKESATSAMLGRVSALQAEGRDIISLNVGEPDFSTPAYIRDAAMKMVRDQMITYTPGPGIPKLREAIAQKLVRENRIDCCAENIILAAGAKQALYSALMVIAGPGDEIIIPTPCYVSYPEMVRMTGASVVFVPLNQETYGLDVKAIEAAVTPRTKGIILCTPCNPTGSVFAEKDLRALSLLALAKDFFVIADEIYEKIIYGDAKHFSIASLSREMFDHTITINGFSKAYAMTGWRIGYACARRDIVAGIQRIQSQITTCVNHISQEAAYAALTGPQDDTENMRREFEKRRDYVAARIAAIPGVSCPPIEGAFYAFFDVSAYLGKKLKGCLIASDADFCSYILEEAGVAMMPGTPYMKPGTVRISYATSMEALKEAFDRIEKALL